MVSYWIDPIIHENHGHYSDPIKLRRPMVVSEIRIVKPQSFMFQLEFLAKDLTSPADSLVLIAHVDRIDHLGVDESLILNWPILTNYIVVKGDYKVISICLEATDPEIKDKKLCMNPVFLI